MTNAEAVYNLSNAIINTFFPDRGAIDVAMLNYGLEGEDEAQARDANVFRCAKSLCMGYVEGSRSENGVSTSVRSEEAVKRALRHWCREFGLDEEEELGDAIVIIRDASKRW